MDVIKVEKRNEQAKANQLRRSGLVPCCVYGGDLPESISIQMDQQTANRLFHTKREGSQVGLELDGRVIPAQIKEKKKMMSGEIKDEDRTQLTDIQNYWRENFKGRVKFISINEADMSVVKKKIRENVLRYGYDTVLYDTFKIQESDMVGTRQDLSLVKDSRDLDKLAKKYNIIMLASVQLAEYMRGKLFLDSSVLSNSKQIKEVLENLFLMRTMYSEELEEKSKFYCRPFRLKKIDDKWIEEEYKPDPNGVYRVLFVEKNRNGGNSSDTGCAYILKFDGDHAIFREVAQCRPKHGEIR